MARDDQRSSNQNWSTAPGVSGQSGRNYVPIGSAESRFRLIHSGGGFDEQRGCNSTNMVR